MEAVGSGLGMIGFNVNYGNPTFISDGQNGYLLDKPTKEESIEEITDRADKIVQYFNNGPTSLSKFHMILLPHLRQQK